MGLGCECEIEDSEELSELRELDSLETLEELSELGAAEELETPGGVTLQAPQTSERSIRLVIANGDFFMGVASLGAVRFENRGLYLFNYTRLYAWERHKSATVGNAWVGQRGKEGQRPLQICLKLYFTDKIFI